jgi:UDP-N-acetylglucosamine 2-epimerase (non-hydrolysing)
MIHTAKSDRVCVLHVVGARPNFMKLAPVYRAIASRRSFVQKIVHTGQHYDAEMSEVFFQQLGIPEPDENLSVGSGTHTRQTAEIMIRLEGALGRMLPDAVIVYGDVNSTVAAALVCARLKLPVAHVEAGLRSFDRSMPEEINRVVTDQLATLHFTPSADGDRNLRNEGIAGNNIRMVGNVMVDTLLRLLDAAEDAMPTNLPRNYGLVTLHRPSNVDDPERLWQIVETLQQISVDIELVFPVHPRTRQRFGEIGVDGSMGRGLHLLGPQSYLEFLAMQRSAQFVITDSGGIQEETTMLGVPCLTLRESTERPITVSCGTNILVGNDMGRLRSEIHLILCGQAKRGAIPELWDGCAGERIANVLEEEFVPLAQQVQRA